MVPGKLIKAEAIYDRPFWRDAGLSGQSASDVGPANTTFDNSPPDGSVGVLFGFVGGASAAAFQAMAPADRRAAVIENLVAVVGEQARTPTDYFEQDWSNEQWTRGCPVGHLPPGVLRAQWRAPALAARRHPLRRHRDGRLLARLHGRRRPSRRARCTRGAARPEGVQGLIRLLVAIAAEHACPGAFGT